MQPLDCTLQIRGRLLTDISESRSFRWSCKVSHHGGHLAALLTALKRYASAPRKWQIRWSRIARLARRLPHVGASAYHANADVTNGCSDALLSVRYIWESDAGGNFAISEDPNGEQLGRGTQINIHLKVFRPEMSVAGSSHN